MVTVKMTQPGESMENTLKYLREKKMQEKKNSVHDAEEQEAKIDVVRTGEQISVPENVSLGAAIEALVRKQDEEEQYVNVEEVFDMNPLEGALAFHDAVTQMFNWVSMTSIPGLFGDQKPRYVNVPISATKTVQIPVGRLVLPGVDGWVSTSWNMVQGRPLFVLKAEVRYKHKYILRDLGKLVRKIGRECSIYKGKAIRAVFPNLAEVTSLEDFFPKFMDLSHVDEGSLIFSKDLEQLVNVTLFTPIEKTEICRKKEISLKRGILLEGPFGVGKTLTAHVTAKKCVENGWTFIYIRSVEDLAEAIEFARAYQPAVVFGEDLDQVLDTNERDEKINSILNTIDGIDAKGTEIIVVLTTNNVDKISQAMLRPERLDAIIPVRPPDAEAVQRLVRNFAKGKLEESEDLTEVGKILDGFIPASIHEVVQRSTLAAIARLDKNSTEDDVKITAQDVIVSAKGMIAHLKLLEPAKKDTREPIIQAADTLGQHISNAVNVAQAVDRARKMLDSNGQTSNNAGLTNNQTKAKQV